LDVAILKCVENNAAGTPINVFALNTTLPSNPRLAAVCGTRQRCALCLQLLISAFQCRGGTVFTSNVETTQPTVSGITGQSINKFVFACGSAVP
jgi:hypothetical protein